MSKKKDSTDDPNKVEVTANGEKTWFDWKEFQEQRKFIKTKEKEYWDRIAREGMPWTWIK